MCEATSTNTFGGTWNQPHSHVHDERTVPIIMAGCIVHARNGHMSTSGLKSEITIVFIDLDFLKDAKISAIRVHLNQIQDYLIFAWIFRTSWPRSFGGKIGEKVAQYWPQQTRFYFCGFLRMCQFW